MKTSSNGTRDVQFNFLKFMHTKLKFLSPAQRLELFPPFFVMRVKVIEMSEQFSHARLKLPLNWRSKNMGNAMFGGNQASLADPIAALACARQFPGFDVWTRKLELDFVAPGTTDLELRFEFPEETHMQIREELAKKSRSNPQFEYGFYTSDGRICTRIRCTVAIRPENYLQAKGIGCATR